jgi:hypothetical protein
MNKRQRKKAHKKWMAYRQSMKCLTLGISYATNQQEFFTKLGLDGTVSKIPEEFTQGLNEIIEKALRETR